MVDEQGHVLLIASAALEISREALDRHVGDREQTIELDAEGTGQLSLVVSLELGLRGRQEGADGIVDEVQREPRSAHSVTEAIQHLESVDALVEYPFAALLVDVLGRVAR